MAINQQPGKSGMMVCTLEGHRDWDSGLFDCCSDCKSLIMAYCCLPCTLCSISQRAGEFMCMPWFVPGGLIALRARLRTVAGIRGSICNDCLAMSFCAFCGITQMQREMDAMGL